MTASLQDDLSELTGEELFHLVQELDRATTAAQSAIDNPVPGRVYGGNMTALWTDLLDAKLLALLQLARITVPIREAAAIVYRARFARHHPVRVPGTELH